MSKGYISETALREKVKTHNMSTDKELELRYIVNLYNRLSEESQKEMDSFVSGLVAKDKADK